MISRTVAIGSSVGLHARPASVLAEAVDDSGVEVTIAFDGEEADAASLLEIMTLGAKHGDVSPCPPRTIPRARCSTRSSSALARPRPGVS